MINFSTGSGFSPAAVVHILDKWLQSGGIRATARIDGIPISQALYRRLARRFGAQEYRIHRGHLHVKEQGAWRILCHRDDIRGFMFGKEVVLKVGKAPDPSEKGIKVQVGVMEATVDPGDDGELGTDDDEVTIKPKKVVEYEEIENAKGETIFRCTECGLKRKKEQTIIDHIEDKH